MTLLVTETVSLLVTELVSHCWLLSFVSLLVSELDCHCWLVSLTVTAGY